MPDKIVLNLRIKILPCLNSGWVQLPVFMQGIILFMHAFWNKVKVGNLNECWIRFGSNSATINAVNMNEKRAAYLVHFGEEVEKNKRIICKCNTDRCVNPNHLAVVEMAEFKMVSKKRLQQILSNTENDFWKNVEIKDKEDCWVWLGQKDKDGYGSFRFRGNKRRAHRLSYEFTNKITLENGVLACHKCDNPSCVNPYHIFPGSPLDNMKDAISKKRISKQIIKNGRWPEFKDFNANLLTLDKVKELEALVIGKKDKEIKEIAQHLKIPTYILIDIKPKNKKYLANRKPRIYDEMRIRKSGK